MTSRTAPTRDQAEEDVDEDEDEDEEEDLEEEERPDDAVDCPFCDRPFPQGVCEACEGRLWLTLDEIDAQLGSNRVPRLRCDGEGAVDYFGPASWSCPSCF